MYLNQLAEESGYDGIVVPVPPRHARKRHMGHMTDEEYFANVKYVTVVTTPLVSTGLVYEEHDFGEVTDSTETNWNVRGLRADGKQVEEVSEEKKDAPKRVPLYTQFLEKRAAAGESTPAPPRAPSPAKSPRQTRSRTKPKTTSKNPRGLSKFIRKRKK